MKYSEFSTEDFVKDEYFRRWVYEPDKDVNLFWEDWLSRNMDKQRAVEEARRILKSMSFKQYKASGEDLDEVWNRIIQTRERKTYLSKEPAVQPVAAEQLPPETTKSNRYFAWKAIAASVVIMMVALLGYYIFSGQLGSNEYVTAFGQSELITLPDGSAVTLNSNSGLKVPRSWKENGTREVWLTGEAFFSVVHTVDDQKFLVHSKEVGIEVLGTEFNVNNRRGKTQVVLNSGSVKLALPSFNVHKAPQTLVMQPGELVEVRGKNEEIIRKVVKPEHYSSWKDNILVFDKVQLGEIVEFIEDNYGYRVDIKSPGLEKEIYSSTLKSRKLDLLLDLLSESFDLKISKNDTKREITMSKEPK